MSEIFVVFLFIFFIIFFSLYKIVKWYRTLNKRERSEFWTGIIIGLSSRNSSSSYDDDEYNDSTYVIQYKGRSGSSWIDGPGSNKEDIAEYMFDRFIDNDPRGNRRCRLVKKRNGRVVSVLSTN